MQYKSTRNSNLRFTAAEVIAKGISEEGGLFVPTSFPALKPEFHTLCKMSYQQLASRIFSCYLTDFTQEEIDACVAKAYTSEKFEGDAPVTLQEAGGRYFLELWHGPTCAFKDMALQILPHLLTASLEKTAGGKTAYILTATSGDTGKAALDGFKDVKGTRISVLYPHAGVSQMQQRQMDTQEGENVSVCAVKGNFDDTQTGVKQIFTDPALKKLAQENDVLFSSANSINIGRLLPQIVYYFYAYFRLYESGAIADLEAPVNIAVPTGNFGNILAGYYASRMGLPVNKFVCASNANHVLTDFINTGKYDKKREFYITASPSMDILVSSNLERLLYHLCGEDCETLSGWMHALQTGGEYQVDADTARAVSVLFYGGCCTDEETGAVIAALFDKAHYLCDTHTAVAQGVYDKYFAETGDNTPAILVSTASPYKFADHVLTALGETPRGDAFDMVNRLEEISGIPAQKQLKDLKKKKTRFSQVITKEEMPGYVAQHIKDWQG